MNIFTHFFKVKITMMSPTFINILPCEYNWYVVNIIGTLRTVFKYVDSGM